MTRSAVRFTTGLVVRAALAVAVIAPAVVTTVPAEASVSIAVQFDELVERSKAVAVLMPVEQRAVWEGRHIITYTRMQVEDGIAGEVETGKEIWVATRGGVIGDIGQHVDGEPIFRVGRPALAFLREDIVDEKPVPASGIFIVTARAQGLFPVIKESEKRRRVVSSAALGKLYPPNAKAPLAPKALARDVLDEKDFDDAREKISTAWKRLHVRTNVKKSTK